MLSKLGQGLTVLVAAAAAVAVGVAATAAVAVVWQEGNAGNKKGKEAKNEYTCSVWSQITVHGWSKWKTHPTSPVIGQKKHNSSTYFCYCRKYPMYRLSYILIRSVFFVYLR